MKYKKGENMGVYGIFHKKNCLYVGQTTNFTNRFNQHFSMLKDKSHHNRMLQSLINEIGFSDIIFKEIMSCDESDLLYYEKLMIQIFCPATNNIVRIKRLPLTKEYITQNEIDLKKITDAFNNTWVSTEQIETVCNLNRKRIGMLMKYSGFKKRKDSSKNGKMFYFIQE